ncbi:mitochondrial 37S ribosomal protein nam9 [Phlyctochytrium planicorne]|nr:mitochondrial 37S ribosomal protein nam9 [Phlyctochytrium planicorne]
MSQRVPIRWKSTVLIKVIQVKDPFHPYRGLIRMSWNKLNLYNLQRRSRSEDLSRRTVFQQKWIAKRELRAYHVPNISERQLLARHWRNQIPLVQMTQAQAERQPPVQALAFGELERRLDVILFRSHFASSIWQARSFVTQGHVKVNGQRCRYPARRLAVGDMVTINPKVIPTLRPPTEVMKDEQSTETEAAEGDKESPVATAKESEPVAKAEAEVKEETTTKGKSEASAESPSETKESAEKSAASKPESSETSKTSANPSASKPKEDDKEKPIAEKWDPAHPKALPFNEVPFMSPWMFIPQYLEVSYNVSSVILVRPPLPQADSVEIPSPHPPDLHALAYEWYSTIKKAKTKRSNLNQPLVVSKQSVKLKPKFDSIMRRRLLDDQNAFWAAKHERDAKLREERKAKIAEDAAKAAKEEATAQAA